MNEWKELMEALHIHEQKFTVEEVEEIIKDYDFVPVVRCKDCKYRIKEGDPFYELVKGLCTLNENFVPDDFYCAEGKKQTYREIQDK